MAVRFNVNAIAHGVRVKTEVELAKLAVTIAEEIEKELSRSGGGRPSKPGQPPRRQSGRLASSVRVERLGRWRYRVGPTANYAAYLERGTTEIAPRPYLARAIQAALISSR